MTSQLHERLTRRITESGPLAFADFVEAALYDPHEGFYADAPVGADRHFVTSPHVSSVFARLIAREAEHGWETAGKPRSFTVVDAGAGDGTLLRGMVAAGSRGFLDAAVFVGVERMAGPRAAIADAGFTPAAGLDELADSSVGFLVANEFLDALPFHRLRAGADGSIHEIRVGVEDGRFVEVAVEPEPGMAASLGEPLEPGEERTVSPASDETVAQIARILGDGYAMIIDYDTRDGWTPVRSYRDHRDEPDLLAAPGSRDLTTGVDLERVGALAAKAGLDVWGPWRQADVLRALGYSDVVRGLREVQHSLEKEGRWRESLRVFGERQAASILIEPGLLGSLRVLVLAANDLTPLAAAARSIADSPPDRR